MPNFIPQNHQFDLSALNTEEVERFEEMIQQIRELQVEFHAEWNRFRRQAKDDMLVSNTARRFWAIEWALCSINILQRPFTNLTDLPTEELRQSLEVITYHEPPTLQMTGGPTLCMIHVYAVKGKCRFASNWMTLESVLSKVRKLRFLLLSLRTLAETERQTFLADLREINPSMLLIGNRPGSVENLTETHTYSVTRVHQVVENLRVFVGFYQRPEEREHLVRTEMQPAWGEAARMWASMGWDRQNTAVLETVAQYPIPQRHFQTMNNKTIISWNVRGAANDNFIEGAEDLIARYNPNVMIITETRVQRERAPFYLRQLPFDKWFATETQGFRGGIWVLWNSGAVNLTVLSSTVQEVHALVSAPEIPRGYY